MTLPKSVAVAALAIVLMLVGAFGPWAKVLGVVTIHGTDNGKDGWVVVGAAAVAAVVLLVVTWKPWRWLALLSLIAGGIAGATAGYDISDINSLGGGDAASAQWGIYLAVAGSIVLMIGSLWALVEIRRPVPEAPTAEPSS
jgi:hypothetical protein